MFIAEEEDDMGFDLIHEISDKLALEASYKSIGNRFVFLFTSLFE